MKGVKNISTTIKFLFIESQYLVSSHDLETKLLPYVLFYRRVVKI